MDSRFYIGPVAVHSQSGKNLVVLLAQNDGEVSDGGGKSFDLASDDATNENVDDIVLLNDPILVYFSLFH